jgi:hypothetical protein
MQPAALHRGPKEQAVSDDISKVRGWFNRGSWGDGGVGVGVIRLVYSLSEWFAYGSVCAVGLCTLNRVDP